MLLIDYARRDVGMPMRGLHYGRHIGWTTDEKKRDALVAAGANCTTATTHSGRVLGYEISFAVGREMLRAVA